MVTEGLVTRANARAQRRFRVAALIGFRTGQWDTPEWRLYQQAERLFDGLKTELAWEVRKAEVDFAMSTDHDMHLHFGAWVADCDNCAVDPETLGAFPDGAAFLAEVEKWAPGELVEAFGR